MSSRLWPLLLACLVFLLGAGAADARERPNILVIMTDDQTVQDLRVMPQTRALLADQGTTFTNSFVSFSLCCPSRATLFTGQYAPNHRVLGLTPPAGGYVKLDTSNYLPLWLQDAGYRTLHLGKFLNGYGSQNPDPTDVPPGFDEWEGSIDPTTYNYTDYTLNENGRLVRYGPGAEYQTDFYAQRASELIERYARDERPFFFSLAFVAPHYGRPVEPDDPLFFQTPAVAPRHRDRFAATPLPRTPDFNERDVSNKPWRIRHYSLLSFDEIFELQELYQQRLESLLAVDEGVGRVVEALRSTGELDNTLILFTSDNGYMIGQHRVRAAKVFGYEPSIRVPLILRGPGVPTGARRKQLVTNADLSPTILAAAEGRARKPQDGRALQPLLADSGLEWGRNLFVQGRGTHLTFNALRTPRYFYAHYRNGNVELYDLKRDPFELKNLNREHRYAPLRKQLQRQLKRLRRCRGRSCYSGPRLRLGLRPNVGCVPGALGVRMVGRDLQRVRRAGFYLRGRRVARAQATLAGQSRLLSTSGVRPGRRFRLRVRVTLNDGQVVTLDRTRRACAGAAP